MAFMLTACGNSTPGSNSPTIAAATVTSKPIIPFIAIRMSDRNNGWALTQNGIFKSVDGGKHWLDVTPANAGMDGSAQADFADTQYAWIAIPTAPTIGQAVKILRTADGGRSWQSTVIPDKISAGVDRPDFLGHQQGWIETIGTAGAGSMPADIWHSTDGGATWTLIATPGRLSPDGPSDPIYQNAQTAIMTGNPQATQGRSRVPGIAITHDGGKQWQIEELSIPPGISPNSYVETTSPVFFGNAVILPVYVGNLDSGMGDGFTLYHSNNSGQTWSPTPVVHISVSRAVLVLDPNHVWATDTKSGQLYATSDGGMNWTQITTKAYTFTHLSFIDASNGWGLTESGLYQTSDGGKIWQQIAYSMQK
jgi:photosystem II stability/assembly factor-like uncharacterized protein